MTIDKNTSAEDTQFLAEVAAESIGWLPLGDGAYLHVGDPEALVVDVVGVLEVGMGDFCVFADVINARRAIRFVLRFS